jgi:acyl dehydratase
MDENVAKMAGLPTIILQGLCTMAFCQQTVVDWADKNPHLLKKIKVEFRGNVLPGDTVTVNGKVTDKKDDRIVVEFQAMNQKGELVIGGGLAEVAV